MTHLLRSSGIILFAVLFISCFRREEADGQSSTGTTAASHDPATKRTLRESCEDCELMFVGMSEEIHSVDTTDGWYDEGQKLIVSGTVFHRDGRTPAQEVLLYYYHTDKKGQYSPGPNMPTKARRHGHLRGWVKTGADGSYVIHTNRPAQYPEGQIEAHIHVIVKEPDMDVPYWIDAWIFEDDPLVTDRIRANLENRGGSGILSVKTVNDCQIAQHDITLGLNIPGYPNR